MFSLKTTKLIALSFTLTLLGASTAIANPMQPDGYVVKPKITVKKAAPVPKAPGLESILIIGDYRVAVFTNGEEKQTGELTKNGYSVDKIEPGFVVLKRGSKETILTLKNTGELVIKPANEE